MSHLKKGNHPPSTAPLESSINSNSNYDTMDESRLNLQAPAFQRVQRSSDTNESNNNNENEMEEKVCRICLEEDSPETMIAPCLCKGGSKWVHRECLDEWRTNEKDRAFAKCTECLFEYHLQPVYKKDDDDDEDLPQTCIVCCVPRNKCTQQQRRKALFYWMVSRDACLGITLQQLIIVVLAYLVWVCDPDHDLPVLLRIPIGPPNLVWLYYGFGWFLFFMFLGFYGSVVMCMNDCDIQKSIPRVGPPTEADARDEAPASSQTSTGGRRTATPSTGRSTAGTVLNVLEELGNANSYPDYRYDPYRDDYDDYYRQPRYSYSSSTRYYRRARRRYYHRNRPRRWYYDDYRRRRWYDDDDYYYYYGPSYYPIYVDDGDGGCCCCCCDSGADHHARTCADCCNSGHHHACLSFFSSSSGSSGSSSSSGSSRRSGNSNGNDAEHIVLLIMLVVAIVMAIIGFCVGVVITVVATQRIVGRHIYLLQKRQLVREFQVMDLQDYDLDQPISSATHKSNSSSNTSSSSSNATNTDTNAPSQTSPLLSGGDGQGLEMAPTRQPPPSAPVMPADDVKYLKSLGLLDR